MSISAPPLPPPTALSRKFGLRAAFEYTGVPLSLFEKRPKLPSRNWLIFLTVSSSLLGYYVYDRRECKLIRQDYIDRVRPLSEEPMGKFELPRKVVVYGAKWPGDEDWDRGTRYFRKYIKPILVAAAVDYKIVAGKRHGDLATRVANDIKDQRRIDAGLDRPWESPMPLPSKLSPEAERHRQLEGGIILIGRPTFKEYMAGFCRGWTESLERVDYEEILSRELQNDGKFDEPDVDEPPSPVGDIDEEPLPTPSRLPPSRRFSPLGVMRDNARIPPQTSLTALNVGTSSAGADIVPPIEIPPQPPLLLVPFVNLVGWRLIPRLIWDFFNERHKVKAGAEAGYKLIKNQTRPFVSPGRTPNENLSFSPNMELPRNSQDDLEFDRVAETYYPPSTSKILARIAEAREEYYRTALEKLKTARVLARREREPTADELKNPPPTEVEIHDERLKKEVRWRGEEMGWNVVKPDVPVHWDPRMDGIFKVFKDPDLPLPKFSSGA
ncbi:inner membrane protein import complex subunit Tim54-domain-containing protein [Vararia minispora EC-137]|uniref:Inner membrane protein import complex subunit Tim54-domain-containing protein n=1 Tax=Vararia minispora EC-137 TaxID=1314806 RepID=A0ACB8QLX6_9AGAM|nr:inner membrane protein import complex subunit Tim54-domain-containing protein [Vararia minispora EC-137]